MSSVCLLGLFSQLPEPSKIQEERPYNYHTLPDWLKNPQYFKDDRLKKARAAKAKKYQEKIQRQSIAVTKLMQQTPDPPKELMQEQHDEIPIPQPIDQDRIYQEHKRLLILI